MLIKQETVMEALAKASIMPKGVLHVGAHECEELPFYQRLGISKDNMVWIDAIQSKVQQAQARGIPNVFKAVVTDKDDDTVTFKITNNVQSSSILDFGTHADSYPWVHFISQSEEKTVTLDTFFERQQLDPSRYEFWNFDIQGAEMLALKGATGALKYAKALYLEVNTQEVYKGCAKLEELDAFLLNLGFQRVLTDITPHGWGDALYVR
jgi:FkbM family methyltransferase